MASMSATSLVSSHPAAPYHSLPPTLNTLPAGDRARLVKTTRKLEAVLGTAPIMLDAPAPTTRPRGHSRSESQSSILDRRARRHGSIYLQPVPRGSSLSLAPLPAITLVDDHTRPVLLRLREPAEPLTPTTPTPQPKTPTSATSAVFPPSEADERRRKLAKLTRHLGENVPPELVVGRRARARSISNAEFAAMVRRSVRPTEAAKAPAKEPEFIGTWNRGDIRDVQKQLRSLKA